MAILDRKGVGQAWNRVIDTEAELDMEDVHALYRSAVWGHDVADVAGLLQREAHDLLRYMKRHHDEVGNDEVVGLCLNLAGAIEALREPLKEREKGGE